MKGYIAKIRAFLLKVVVILIITLMLLEFSYRYQLIDFYKTEWNYLNRNVQESEGNTKILVFGDSFSSAKNNWVEQVQKMDSSSIYYNASFPGVATETYRLIAKNRIEEVNPDRVIVQLYTGNDLLDIHKPINWSELTFSRNLFWTFSNYFRFLNFFNFRMGQVSQDVVKNTDPKEEEQFSTEHYSARTQLYIKAIPNYPQSELNIDSSSNFKNLVNHLKDIKKYVKNKEFYVLIVPHCTEVGQQYIANYKELGAIFTTNNLKQNYWEEKLLKEGFNVISPYDYFRNLEKTTNSIYFQNDPHLNDKGQYHLAKSVANFFQSK